MSRHSQFKSHKQYWYNITMTKLMGVFGQKSKHTEFEEWLSENGYFYVKTKDNRPCFKSKLTQHLQKKFNNEKQQSKRRKIFSFYFGDNILN